ncbi:MAG: prolipoprotein diacylglyceryl transferase [Lachnospiraceae bacterium]|nr:prolipoprotein diacylglyceryl transferase [Lachnospiraceae bacterium]MDY3223782.1 prolipoprotein diacylglyceryl transferase [Lachnospiraceae bacterium]
MYNDLFSIGPVTIRGYGLMIGLGIVAAILLGEYRAKKRGLNGEAIYGLTFFAVVTGFAAAKLLFILTQWENFLKNPKAYLSFEGFVVFGGIIGAILSLYLYCRVKKLDLLDYLDLMAPSVALAQAFGRVGCFLAGCCYGRETDSCIGVVFTHSAYAPNGVKLLPTQLFMSAGDLLLMLILLWYSSKERMKGRTTMLYLILYSLGRFALEFLRNDNRGTVGILSTSQFIGILTAIAGAIGYWIILPMLEKRNVE